VLLLPCWVCTPRELFDERGNLKWSAKSDVWGLTQVNAHKAANDEIAPDCNIRFLGQYYDKESGLHYNRFRYYDPETAQYISPDPIGLAGGDRPYGYVHNPISWVDPLGLANYDNANPSGNTGNNQKNVYIPRNEHGNPIPLNKQRVNGQDIPLPDPTAEGRPHTVLGGKVSSLTGEMYRQSATFSGETWPKANGYDVPWSEVHWSNRGRGDHYNPHQHIFTYDPAKGGWIRGGMEVLHFFPNLINY